MEQLLAMATALEGGLTQTLEVLVARLQAAGFDRAALLDPFFSEGSVVVFEAVFPDETDHDPLIIEVLDAFAVKLPGLAQMERWTSTMARSSRLDDTVFMIAQEDRKRKRQEAVVEKQSVSEEQASGKALRARCAWGKTKGSSSLRAVDQAERKKWGYKGTSFAEACWCSFLP